MIHLGDITKIDGSKILPVDVIIGGSPCQDLSIAGKREGLSGERSGLFMEQIRIIKEMHKEYGTAYPRFMVWENVPGALSSSKGEDFRIVLEETAKIAEPDTVIPGPPKGKWRNSGCIMGDGWSIAWRILDAQFWGVPQRRRRIALVADFGGQSAPEILFERKGVSGDFEESGTPWQGVAGTSEKGAGASGCVCLNDQTLFVPFVKGTRPHSPDEGQQWKDGTAANTLNTFDVGEARCNELAVKVYGICSKDSNAMKSDNPKSGFYEAETSRCLDTNGGNPSCNQGSMAVVAVQGSMIGRSDKNDPQGSGVNEDVSFTLDATDRHAVTYGIDRATYNMGRNAKFGLGIEEEPEPTIVAKGPGAVAYCMTTGTYIQTLKEQSPVLMARDYKSPPVVNETEPEHIVRRLTPTEYERLQGFPDGWTDIGNYIDTNGKKKQSSDTARYKALGNSIALPPWRWVLRRLCNQYDRFATMGSLFDGIGGFPLIWEEINGKGSCLWASEIEEFPIAATKIRFSQ